MGVGGRLQTLAGVVGNAARLALKPGPSGSGFFVRPSENDHWGRRGKDLRWPKGRNPLESPSGLRRKLEGKRGTITNSGASTSFNVPNGRAVGLAPTEGQLFVGAVRAIHQVSADGQFSRAVSVTKRLMSLTERNAKAFGVNQART